MGIFGVGNLNLEIKILKDYLKVVRRWNFKMNKWISGWKSNGDDEDNN